MARYISVPLISFLVVFFFCWTAPEGIAQKKTSESLLMQISAVTAQKVQAMIKEIEGNKELDEAMKNKLLTRYQQAQSALVAADSYERIAASYLQAIKSSPGEVKEIRKKIEAAQAAVSKLTVGDYSKLSLSELEFRLTVAGTELDALRGDLEAIDTLLQEQRARPGQIREEQKTAREALSEIDKEMAALRVSQEHPMLVEARRIALIATRRSRLQEIDMLNKELLSYGPRVQVLTAQRDLRALTLGRAQAQVKALQDVVAARQREESDKRRALSASAEQVAAGKHPAIRRLAEGNARLVQELNVVVEDQSQSLQARDGVRDELRRVDRDYLETRRKIEVAGRSRALGHLLLEEYRRLPDVNVSELQQKKTQKKISVASLRLLEVEESQASPGEVSQEVKKIVEQDITGDIPPQDLKALEAEIRQLMSERQNLLRKLSDAYGSYLDTLSDLENRQKLMVETLGKFRTLLDEWILWVPSAKPFSKVSFKEVSDLWALFASGANWKQVGEVIKADVTRAPLAVLLFLILFTALLWGRRWLRAQFERIERRVEDRESDRFALTLLALLVTVLLSVPLPLLFGALGWRLQEAPEALKFARAMGNSLSMLVLPTLYLRTLYHFCSPNGVAVVHFRWSQGTAALLRRNLLWFTVLFVPLVSFIKVNWELEEVFRSRGGTLAFIAAMATSALFLQRVLRPRGGAVEEYLIEHPDGLLSRLSRLWYPVVVLTPLALIGLALAGYLFTAVVLSGHVIRSFWVILGALIVDELALRWLRLSDRRLGQPGSEDRSGAGSTGRPGDVISRGAGQTEPEGSLIDSSAQTLRMFHFLIGFGLVAGLLMVWSDILPALSILQQVKLWQNTVTVGGKEVQQPFTLWSLAVMVTLIAATVMLWRNLPGVVDFAALQRLRISAASRYAIRRMIRYSIVAIGIVAVFKAIGGEWSQVQWLVAALSVGLGFGLQEIVANFISGIILLFEQPIRVGDVVTIGDVSGKVARIDIRATTITDFDNKDLVVPNKSFITGQLINWTLTSPITRLTIKVGIAYGSETALAHKVMLDTVRANPLVLENPEPKVFFTGFGESSLDFTVYVFVKELSERLPVTHELHMAIEQALREHGIEIPFPQRDIRVRSLPASSTEDDRETKKP